MKKQAILTILMLIFVLVVLGSASATDPTTERVSTTDTQGNGGSYTPSITPDGRYIAFESGANNLVSEDTNGVTDIFVKDGWTGAITRVSTTSTGAQASGGGSSSPVITPDGRYIAFTSDATNLVSEDTNGVGDIFVKDGWTGAITRVNTNATGGQATSSIYGSFNPSITPNGRYITFYSYASNLVSEDTNGEPDVFVKDGWTGAITRVSTTSTGEQSNDYSGKSSITSDGRYVAFESEATNLVSEDTNAAGDIFVKDGWTGQITLVSKSANGTLGNNFSWGATITSDGRYIAFTSDATNLVAGDTNGYWDIFVKDGWTGAITRISTTSTGGEATGDSERASITPNGRYIVFNSYATNLVSGDSNDARDVFVKDGWTGAITRISTSASGTQGNDDNYDASITPDGRYIVFESGATNLVSGDTNGYPDIFVKDGWTGAVTFLSTSAIGGQANAGSDEPSITPDGRYVVFESDASNLVGDDYNDCSDIFVHDNVTKRTIRVSTSTTGGQANGGSSSASITSDGRYIAFESTASNLVSGDTNSVTDIFVKDMRTGQVTRVSTNSTGGQATGGNSYHPSITPNGRYIVFESDATNLVASDTNGNTDIFIKDGWTGAITRVSTNATGAQANGGSYDPSITPDGRYITFESAANNLVPGDTNSNIDIFVKDGLTGQIIRASTSASGIQGNDYSECASITPDGRYIVFKSYATNLVSGDTNAVGDIFVKDGWTGAITRVSTSLTGGQANNSSDKPSITPDGRYIVFTSYATNLVSGDTNDCLDVFVKDGWTGQITRTSLNISGVQGNNDSSSITITPDGRCVVFQSDASNLVSSDTNSYGDIFIRKFW